MRQQQEMAEESARNAEEAAKKREEERQARRQAAKAARHGGKAPQGISNKQLKLMSLALVLKILSQDKVTTILNKFDSADSQAISQYMNMADLESQIDGDLITDCIKQMKEFLPTKRKLSKENVMSALNKIYATEPREKVEKIIKNERPLVKRFISQTYDGEFGNLPLKVVGIVTEYIEESI